MPDDKVAVLSDNLPAGYMGANMCNMCNIQPGDVTP
jgi:hypothetical protein